MRSTYQQQQLSPLKWQQRRTQQYHQPDPFINDRSNFQRIFRAIEKFCLDWIIVTSIPITILLVFLGAAIAIFLKNNISFDFENYINASPSSIQIILGLMQTVFFGWSLNIYTLVKEKHGIINGKMEVVRIGYTHFFTNLPPFKQRKYPTFQEYDIENELYLGQVADQIITAMHSGGPLVEMNVDITKIFFPWNDIMTERGIIRSFHDAQVFRIETLLFGLVFLFGCIIHPILLPYTNYMQIVTNIFSIVWIQVVYALIIILFNRRISRVIESAAIPNISQI